MLTSIIPPNAGEWAHRPFLRWRLADEAAEAEGEPSAIRAWHLCGDLKPGLSKGEWMDVVEGFVRTALPVTALAEIAGHLPADKPAHAHILVAPRRVGERFYGETDFELYDLLNVDLRRSWERWLLN